MATAEQVQDQIDQNYTAFTALLPDLMKTSAGKWALLHDAALEGVFDTARDARLAGEKLYVDGLFLRPASQGTGRWTWDGSLMLCIRGQ